MKLPNQFSEEDRQYLLGIARRTLREITTRHRAPVIAVGGLDPKFSEKRGCFVTLRKDRDLHGCMGDLLPRAPLYQAVIDNTANAAVRDIRFPVITEEDADEIRIEISVLSPLKPMVCSSWDGLLSQLQPGTDGVVLQLGNRSATYLPQVWKEYANNKTHFIEGLVKKAGFNPADPNLPMAAVSTYTVESFKEETP